MTWWGAVLVGVTLYCKDLADRYIYIYIHTIFHRKRREGF